MKLEATVEEHDWKWFWHLVVDDEGRPPCDLRGGPYQSMQACRCGLLYQLSLLLVERTVI